MKHTIVQKNNLNRGFSIVELVVVILIFSIMSGVTIVSFRDHQQAIEEVNLAQDIALTIRQTQSYGLSASNRVIGEDSSDFDDAGTVFFANDVVNIAEDRPLRGISINADQQTLTLYENLDSNETERYFDPNVDRVIDQRTVTAKSVSIANPIQVCLEYLNIPGSCQDIIKLDIAFQRPYHDAVLIADDDDQGIGAPTFVVANIYLEGGSHYIEVTTAGSVNVRKV